MARYQSTFFFQIFFSEYSSNHIKNEYNNYENSFASMSKFTKYFEESCLLDTDQHFFFGDHVEEIPDGMGEKLYTVYNSPHGKN